MSHIINKKKVHATNGIFRELNRTYNTVLKFELKRLCK